MNNIQLPSQNRLTIEQQLILNEKNSVGIFGGAGTGKTIISIHRHIENWEKRNIKSFLITYTHTLTYYFEKILPNESLEASKNVDNIDNFLKRFEKGEFSEIEELIIDEAQDITLEIHKQLKEKFKISYGADDNQILYPHKSSSKSELTALHSENKNFTVTQNFRNSFNILKFVDSVFPNRLSAELLEYSKIHYAKSKTKPNLVYSNNKTELEKALIKLIKKISPKESLAILVPTKELMLFYRELFTKENIEYSTYYYEDNKKAETKIRNNGISRIHLTPFKSSKGLEFDNVIMPNFHEFNFWKTEHKYVVKESDYYVGMTRAKNNLFLFTENISILDYVDSETCLIKNI